MLSSRMSRSELSSHGPAASIPSATASPGSSGKRASAATCSCDEAGVRRVAVERLDQVVAVRPGIGPDPVLVVAVGLGEMDQVHPVPRPALAVMGAGEQAIDQPLVGVGRSIVRGTASTSSGVGGRPSRSNESRRINVRRSASGDGLEPFSVELGEDEGVDRSCGPRPLAQARRGGTAGRRERPERPPIAARLADERRCRGAAGARRAGRVPPS